MLTVLVINSKGGSGKTTLTTNIASYYADKALKTTILDYDPQNSSLHWLAVRPAHLHPIHGANAAPAKGFALRSMQAWVPEATEVLVIDAPAGANGLMLKELVRKANYILIPVGNDSDFNRTGTRTPHQQQVFDKACRSTNING